MDRKMTDGDRDTPPAGPRTQVAIHILDDGRVVFGDLPPELAEVAAILRGDPSSDAEKDPGHDRDPSAH